MRERERKIEGKIERERESEKMNPHDLDRK